MFKNMIAKNRSYRRFYEDEIITQETLLSLVDYARLSASGGNKQPLRYVISCEKELNATIFSTLAWAGYLTDWPGPVEGERPTGYVIILQDKNNKMVGGVDHGIAAQSIVLGAVEIGLGGCMIASVKRSELAEALAIPEQYEILLVIALGKPKEVVVVEDINVGEDVKYWRDENQVHHVPKLKLKDIVLQLK
ncbi:nitroreductase family protein [Pelosinus sp. sgz500959]|uniref:nitroreductase family protein n=1 Tax=Pelosinus sp. sgz500959 TaxID=3242472 RepID=UPI0036721F61